MNKEKLPITIASLTLRFYKDDGWNLRKVRNLLVNSRIKIVYRKELKYYAVYSQNGYKIFKKSKVIQHKILDHHNFGGLDWYLEE